MGAVLSLESDTIQNNNAWWNAGGIENFGTLEQEGGTTKILSNQAMNGDGGGIWNSGQVNFNGGGGNVYIQENTAYDSGGGVFNGNGANFNMSGGAISGNSAQNGGGLYNQGTATLNNGLEVTGNQASTGAGMFLTAVSTTTLHEITIQGNILQPGGGGGRGIYAAGGATVNTDSTVYDPDDPSS